MLQTINEYHYNHALIGCKCDLTSFEKDIITSELSKGNVSCEITSEETQKLTCLMDQCLFQVI